MRKSSARASRRISKALQYVLLSVFGIIFLAPIYYLIVGSFRPSDKVLAGLSGFLPTELSFDNYAAVFSRFSNSTTGYLWQFIAVSVVVTVVVVVGGVLVNSLAGYALARMRWKGRGAVLVGVTILTIIPFEAVALPLYYLLADSRNTVYVQALPFIANAFFIFLFYTFFLDIPVEVEEAARIDGAGPLRTFFQIVVPISRPAFATVAILSFLAQWGSYLWPVLMVTDTSVRPLPLELSVFQTAQPPEWGSVLAFGVIFVLPVLVIFLIFQRWFVSSVASSAVKG
ncbi:multiple sugar transport system permease protein [Microbacterium endophyticum]|uniref:Multiple sugar transport system permease protein n=1 Tax=Microbacterium endophyticum TaxID=1526412 RepID=A0A7W4V6J0_9MICO|nr:carbohydrate ABC transporter permease [Microbacterium endophyticum]MBB2977133.1 multiple sugar transport system permease protein [Microbacterium endophyticum]NIK36061.1 multiple sugar transport system permease protein [Microbacterium endophyticum]